MAENDTRGAALRKLASRTGLVVAVVLVAVKLLAWDPEADVPRIDYSQQPEILDVEEWS